MRSSPITVKIHGNQFSLRKHWRKWGEGGSFSIAFKLSTLSSAALHNPSRSVIWSVIMLLSGDITYTETGACSIRSRAATENILKK